MFLFGKQIRKLESIWNWVETNLFQPLYKNPTLENEAKVVFILIFTWPILLGIFYGWLFLLMISGIFWTEKDKANFIEYNRKQETKVEVEEVKNV